MNNSNPQLVYVSSLLTSKIFWTQLIAAIAMLATAFGFHPAALSAENQAELVGVITMVVTMVLRVWGYSGPVSLMGPMSTPPTQELPPGVHTVTVMPPPVPAPPATVTVNSAPLPVAVIPAAPPPPPPPVQPPPIPAPQPVPAPVAAPPPTAVAPSPVAGTGSLQPPTVQPGDHQ